MTIAIESPAVTVLSLPQTDDRFRATFLGLSGWGTAPLHQITDARLVTVSGTVTERRFEGRTVWLRLRAGDGALGLVGLDLAEALVIPADVYAVGRAVQVAGVARTHRNLDGPYVAARRLTAVDAEPGPEPLFVLGYSYGPDDRRAERTLTRAQVELVGAVVARAADRGEAWEIEVLDAAGDDVTEEFACFA